MVSPKLSVITIAYNAASYIENTIKSVIEQTYKNIEYIIIDGRSTDDTMDIVTKYKNNIDSIVSEPDKGIYDAMNKGLHQAKGDYVLFMNSGDRFFSESTVSSVFATVQNADVYYGDMQVVDDFNNVIGLSKHRPPRTLTWKDYSRGMLICHQSFIAKRTLCVDYDISYKISSDIDWSIKILKKAEKIHNTGIIISKYLNGGTSSQKRITGLKERFKIYIHHYGILTTLLSHVYIVFKSLKIK